MDHCGRLVVGLLLASFVFGPAQAGITFSDVSRSAGIDRPGESYGASWGDLNGDGLPDIFASNHRTQPSLFLNRGNGTFHETGPQVLTWQNRSRADTHGGTWADFDNDGDQDLLVSAGTGNLSQLLVNEHQRLVDRTVARGLTTSNLGGRLPVWFDYDGDGLTDFVMTQYGGIAKLYRQGPPGQFTETTSSAKLLCKRFHYGQLLDFNHDGALDLLCSDEALWPQKIYDMQPFPWRKIYDNANPAAYLPPVSQGVDSTIADFDNDGRMDLFVLGGMQLRPSDVTQSSATHFEAQLMNGIKGVKFVSSGKISFILDWNKQDERKTTDYTKIKIGSTGFSPGGPRFTLDPADPKVRGLPPVPSVQSDIPMMQIGYNASTKQWTVVVWAQLSPTGTNVFSETYMQVDSTAAITGLTATGRWVSDKPAKPTLLMNKSGGFINQTAAAGLDVAMSCVSATAGDFDNDMDVDLYLACREGTSNIVNQLWENLGDGTFRQVAGAGGAAGPTGIAVASGAGTADTVVTADYDVDGYLDLFVTNGFNLRPLNIGGENKLFRNTGSGRRWIEVDLIGKRDKEATGARIYATAAGVRQLREQNGGYHRWAQDMKRAHFGLGSATTVDLRVEWPSGTVQTFSNVATNKLYSLTEGGALAPVRVGVAPAYQCGAPPLNGALDKGVFIWRDCPSGEWRMKTAAAGGNFVYSGKITSKEPFVSVKGVGLASNDTFARPDPQTITFRYTTTGKSTDGLNFKPADAASACLSLQLPAGTQGYYGPFRSPFTGNLDLDLRSACTP